MNHIMETLRPLRLCGEPGIESWCLGVLAVSKYGRRKRMAILDVIEFLDPTGRQIIHRVPEGGSGEFRIGSQLVVRESQAAVFFRDGKALDVFGPGRHTLSTANIPLLANL